MTIDELGARFDGWCNSGTRRIIGLTGPPGAGKSTLATWLRDRAPDRCVIVPMDGFHLANCELVRLGRTERKGAEDTFDSAGFVALLRRIRGQAGDEIVYAPEFHREIEEPVAGAIAIAPKHQIIITEGLYLLLETGNWSAVRALVDDICYLDIPMDVRVERLIARHVVYGRDEWAAREWVTRSDEINAAVIAATRARADLIVDV